VSQTISGGAFNDTLIGLGGDDVLNGSGGNDTLIGGDGNDVLRGGTGIDVMVGGTGDDTYYVDNIGDVVTELAGEGTDTVHTTISTTLGDNVENLVSDSAAGLTLTGNDLDNMIEGGAGNDQIQGGAGIDTAIFGGKHTDYTVTLQGERLGGGAGPARGSPDGTTLCTTLSSFSSPMARGRPRRSILPTSSCRASMASTALRSSGRPRAMAAEPRWLPPATSTATASPT